MVTLQDISQAGFFMTSLLWKVCTAVLILYTEATSAFIGPLVAVWISYFSLAAVMTVYFRYNPHYLLVSSKWTLRDLSGHIQSSARDLLVLLPASVLIIKYFKISKLVLTDPLDITSFYSSPLTWVGIPLGIFIGLIWRMGAHRLLHQPPLYKALHKMHHITPERMTPFATFNDHPIEFFVMEVIGTFLIPVILTPVPSVVLAGIWSMQCCLGVCDHSNAVVPGSWFLDAEYHLTHHQLTHCNYAEMQLLDKIFGTLHTGPVKWRKPDP
mmetsp:Transcript_1910/g.3031  ORF Transcript_1910/g.3031 Transcript_1910/m.3031 type:complete len:269 (+) Transcript_1910:262-1068(+)